MPQNPVAGPSSAVSPPKPSLRFKHSPFFRVDSAVSGIVECPGGSIKFSNRSRRLTRKILQNPVGLLIGVRRP